MVVPPAQVAVCNTLARVTVVLMALVQSAFFTLQFRIKITVLLHDMNANLRKLLAFFFTCLFLFPTVQVGLHELQHKAEVLCTAQNAKHFHAKEHRCSLGDFNDSFQYYLTENLQGSALLAYTGFSFSFSSFELPQAHLFTGAPRGPPLA